MRYALLVYDDSSSWENVPTSQKQALHGEYHALANSPCVTDHYRIKQQQSMKTVRVSEDRTVISEGVSLSQRELRAFFVVESADPDSVLELAARAPAARMGGAVEVWPLTDR
ncbi:MAG: hypothetical protein MSC30_12615 [Gaiellaceae bacterium MAG52_C11]|nr:hypothetical protein [Candidatus Gaiellasilicea maunaloa]